MALAGRSSQATVPLPLMKTIIPLCCLPVSRVAKFTPDCLLTEYQLEQLRAITRQPSWSHFVCMGLPGRENLAMKFKSKHDKTIKLDWVDKDGLTHGVAIPTDPPHKSSHQELLTKYCKKPYAYATVGNGGAFLIETKSLTGWAVLAQTDKDFGWRDLKDGNGELLKRPRPRSLRTGAYKTLDDDHQVYQMDDEIDILYQELLPRY